MVSLDQLSRVRTRGVAALRRVVRQSSENLRFELDWHLLANRKSAREYSAQAQPLTEVQASLVSQLRARGIASISMRELLASNPKPWEDFAATMRQFASSERVVEEAARYRANHESAGWKEYVIKLLPPRPTIPWDSPLLQIPLNEQVLGAVNAYLGVYSRMLAANAWYTVPIEAQRGRAASQNWHRDPEDRRLIKAFLYVNRVDNSCGPLEYIPGSRVGGPYAHIWRFATGTGVYGYPPQDTIERTVPQAERVVCTCPEGTLVLCDTSGFHRGGYSTGGERMLGVWMYVTPASRYTRDFIVQGRPASALPLAVTRALQ